MPDFVWSGLGSLARYLITLLGFKSEAVVEYIVICTKKVVASLACGLP